MGIFVSVLMIVSVILIGYSALNSVETN